MTVLRFQDVLPGLPPPGGSVIAAESTSAAPGRSVADRISIAARWQPRTGLPFASRQRRTAAAPPLLCAER